MIEMLILSMLVGFCIGFLGYWPLRLLFDKIFPPPPVKFPTIDPKPFQTSREMLSDDFATDHQGRPRFRTFTRESAPGFFSPWGRGR